MNDTMKTATVEADPTVPLDALLAAGQITETAEGAGA